MKGNKIEFDIYLFRYVILFFSLFIINQFINFGIPNLKERNFEFNLREVVKFDYRNS